MGHADSGRRLWLEPAATFVAVILGASLWYPAQLAQPLLYAGAGAPVVVVLALLGLGVALAASTLGRQGCRARLAAVLLLVGASAPLPLQARAALAGSGGHPSSLVVLGVDSVSQADDLRSLQRWVEAEGGAWYTRAVAPGLLTNAVWSSIMAGRPVSDHTVFHTFQHLPVGECQPPPRRAPGRLSDRLDVSRSTDLRCGFARGVRRGPQRSGGVAPDAAAARGEWLRARAAGAARAP